MQTPLKTPGIDEGCSERTSDEDATLQFDNRRLDGNVVDLCMFLLDRNAADLEAEARGRGMTKAQLLRQVFLNYLREGRQVDR